MQKKITGQIMPCDCSIITINQYFQKYLKRPWPINFMATERSWPGSLIRHLSQMLFLKGWYCRARK
jgi:hypothetical protein